MHLIYDKYAICQSLVASDTASLLDVGCRDAILKKFIPDNVEYFGMDIESGPGVTHLGSAEDGFPFTDKSVDIVVALDLLEHTNNIWFVFDELLRVAKKKVIVLLPNAYHWSFRLQYLRGKEMSKYILPSETITDRHRWLVSYNTGSNFCHKRAEKNGWKLTSEILLHGGRRHLLIDLALKPLSKNASSWAMMYVLEPQNTAI